MPCAAACSASALMPARSACVVPASQLLKLSVMMSPRLLSTMYSSDRSTPSVVSVVAETTSRIFAPCATAPDQVVSRKARMLDQVKRFFGPDQVRLLLKIVQGPDPGHDRRQGIRNLWVRCVCPMQLPIHRVLMDGGMKGLADLGGNPAELDHRPAFGDLRYLKAVGGKPTRHRLQILI